MKICASCAEENPDRARFCLACGSELPVERDERFRKVITLLFSDVVGSTSLGEKLDPEALSNVMTQYYETMKPIVERHGGTVAKFIGDAIMAVFGIPVLREDDALRACRAAVEMRERLAQLNVELERRWGVTLSTRTGLNTGEVSGVGVARVQNFVAGDAANTAARFQQNAQAGEILMGEPTYRLVRDGVRIEVAEPLPMKGKAQPVPAYLLIDVRPDAEALTRRHDAPLVGRQAELGALERTFREIVRERSCAMVTLLGDAGVGKSRLVEEFARRVSERGQVLRGRCLSYGEGVTFWPLLEIVRQVAGIDEDDAPEVAREKLRRVAGSEAEDAVERVESAVALSDVAFPVQEIFWGTRRLLETIALRQPLVVIVDDVHWAQPTLLDLIEHLVDAVSDAPLLLVCAARHDLVEQRPAWGDRANVAAIHLKPLSDAEVSRVIANMLDDLEIAADARARIVAAAEGNPLFVEQMLSMMIDDGVLRRVDGRLEAAADLTRISVPPSINALLAARVDRLPRDERAVVGPASVVGLVFARRALGALTDEPVRSALPNHLTRLSEKQLVRPEAEESADGDQYRFNHLLIRDAAYEGVLKETRARLHEGVGEWAERVYRERGREAEFEEILGYHFEQAHRYWAELGPLDAHARALGARAAERLGAAGRRAFARSDMASAANLLERAVSLLPAQDPRRLELVSDLGEALMDLGEFAKADRMVGEAIETATALGDDAARADVTLTGLLIQGYSSGAGWGEDVVDEVANAIAELERAGSHSGLAKAWRILGSVHGTACRFGEAAKAVQQAMAYARAAGDGRQELRSASAYVLAAVNGPTPVEEATDECREILEQAEGDRRTQALTLEALAQLQAMAGDPDAARSSYVSAQWMLEDLGLRVRLASASLASSRVEFLADDPEGAERELRRDFDALDAMGERYLLSTIAGLLAEAVCRQGRDDEAELLTEKAEAIASPNDVFSQALWRSVRAKLLARRGDHEGALRLAREAVELLEATDAVLQQADALADLAEVMRLAGQSSEAEAALHRAVGLSERKGNRISATKARAALRELAAETAGGKFTAARSRSHPSAR